MKQATHDIESFNQHIDHFSLKLHLSVTDYTNTSIAKIAEDVSDIDLYTGICNISINISRFYLSQLYLLKTFTYTDMCSQNKIYL